jgi:hypothetical protein
MDINGWISIFHGDFHDFPIRCSPGFKFHPNGELQMAPSEQLASVVTPS